MKLDIRYCCASDGFNIAYAEVGQGFPLVVVPSPPMCDMAIDWDLEGYILGPLSERFRLINYDPRGCGRSQRPATDFSIEAMLRDFEAVARATGLERCAVWGSETHVPTAITIAAHWPELVYSDDLTYGTLAATITRFLEPVASRPLRAGENGAATAERGGLSAREHEVLALAAAGYTNAQIADALSLSPHTVGRHLSNIFAKIGVANRAEAATWAARHPAGTPS